MSTTRASWLSLSPWWTDGARFDSFIAPVKAMVVVMLALFAAAFFYVVWNEQAYRQCQSGESGYEQEFENGQHKNCQDLRPWFDRR